MVAHAVLLPNRLLNNLDFLVSQPVQLIHNLNPTFFIVGCLRHSSSKNLDQKGARFARVQLLADRLLNNFNLLLCQPVQPIHNLVDQRIRFLDFRFQLLGTLLRLDVTLQPCLDIRHPR